MPRTRGRRYAGRKPASPSAASTRSRISLAICATFEPGGAKPTTFSQTIFSATSPMWTDSVSASVPSTALGGLLGYAAGLGERGADADRNLDGEDPARIADGAVDDHRRGHHEVRDEDVPVLVGHELRVAQRHLGDDAGVLADGDPVAEADRLREGQQDAGAEVPERRREREPRDQSEHGARREEGARDLLGDGEDREDVPEPEQDDECDDDAEEEPEGRPAARSDRWIPLGQPALVAVEAGAEREAHGDHDDEPDRADDECLRSSWRVHPSGRRTAEPTRPFAGRGAFAAEYSLVRQLAARVQVGEGRERRGEVAPSCGRRGLARCACVVRAPRFPPRREPASEPRRDRRHRTRPGTRAASGGA